MIKKATEFTVVRSKWFRGNHRGSMLLRPTDGRMCCMGFYALACGATEDQISELRSLAELDDETMDAIELNVVFGGNPDTQGMQVYNLNDNDKGDFHEWRSFDGEQLKKVEFKMPKYPGPWCSQDDMKEYYFAMAEWYSFKGYSKNSVDFYIDMAANWEAIALSKSYWD